MRRSLGIKNDNKKDTLKNYLKEIPVIRPERSESAMWSIEVEKSLTSRVGSFKILLKVKRISW